MNNPKFYSMIGQLEDKRRMLLETLVYGAPPQRSRFDRGRSGATGHHAGQCPN